MLFEVSKPHKKRYTDFPAFNSFLYCLKLSKKSYQTEITEVKFFRYKMELKFLLI